MLLACAQANCGLRENWGALTILGPDARSGAAEPFNTTSAVNGTCYVTGSSIKFRTGAPQADAQITLDFTPAMTLGPGARVTVGLPGFTRADAPYAAAADDGSGARARALDVAMGHVMLTDDEFRWAWNASLDVGPDKNEGQWTSLSRFDGAWTEGCCHTYAAPGFANATLTLRLRAGHYLRAGTSYSVTVVSANGIEATCGKPGGERADYTLAVAPFFSSNSSWAPRSFSYDDDTDDADGKRYRALDDDDPQYGDGDLVAHLVAHTLES